jgi:predicted TIM-barrel fold metal-dependent hydrolase
MSRFLVVSADGHAGGPPELYLDYIEERYKPELEALIPDDTQWRDTAISQRRFSDETLALIDRGEAIKGGGEFGAWELDRRLVELDREGVAAEILIAGHQVSLLPFFGVINKPASAELRAAGVRAYHRHLADGMADSDGRLHGIADPGTCLDMDDTVAELRWVADHGFVGVAPPGQIDDPALPPLTSDYFEPFWSACVDSGLVLNIHAGWGFPQFGGMNMNQMATGDTRPEDLLEMQMTADVRIDQFPKDSPIRLGLTKPRRALWMLMMAGVFDRHPDLKLVFTEVRADWVAATLSVLDKHFADGHGSLKMKPSDYWAQHCYAAPSSPRTYELADRHAIGVDRFMFGMDYPHPEGTWPNTREWLRNTLTGVSEDEARRFLGLNAVECYGLDEAKLSAIADKIGLLPAEVLGVTEPVNPDLVRNFHSRSGYSRPAEQVDEAFYVEMISEDEAVLAAAVAS